MPSQSIFHQTIPPTKNSWQKKEHKWKLLFIIGLTGFLISAVIRFVIVSWISSITVRCFCLSIYHLNADLKEKKEAFMPTLSLKRARGTSQPLRAEY